MGTTIWLRIGFDAWNFSNLSSALGYVASLPQRPIDDARMEARRPRSAVAGGRALIHPVHWMNSRFAGISSSSLDVICTIFCIIRLFCIIPIQYDAENRFMRQK
ncbi:hypothetical protein [Bifidobacterium vespertilionis]|uniref:hypothetical protein n=1 Tax=Bifidobacterium vespertilionis TaxID=2562524 RepID=UPI001BDD02EF|nr:hypothetical protein [Bifidobacterium vespertilionis]MBT1180222.1 hypothetical protein [Bifidobacterium vespertilionis]